MPSGERTAATSIWFKESKNLAHKRAKKKSMDFDITIQDLYSLFPKDFKCPILGIELKGCGAEGSKQESFRDDSATLDRVDNNLGYIKGNVMYISGLANRMKNSASPEQLIKFANYINKNYK